jgi:hypothetical protein
MVFCEERAEIMRRRTAEYMLLDGVVSFASPRQATHRTVSPYK